MNNNPEFTAIIALSLIIKPQIKNKNEPRFNNIIFSGSKDNAVHNAPPRVIKVAVHLIKETLSILYNLVIIFKSFFIMSYYNIGKRNCQVPVLFFGNINFDNKYFRKDIGKKGLKSL